MIVEIFQTALIIILCGLDIYLFLRMRKTNQHIANLALVVARAKEDIDRVDKSTGSDIYRLRKEFETFKEDYGDAAIEEMRESARREKAWADGIDNIMSYGASVYGSGHPGRGDST